MSGGMLEGLRVVELASETAAFAGKLLGDLGADVIVVEPPGGHRSRTFGPFVDDVADPDRCLWWWYYNTSKRSVVLDLDRAAGAAAFAGLVGGADVVLEAESPDALGRRGLDHPRFRREKPDLIWVSVTPFGRNATPADFPATDLTLLAGAGTVWSCGYDDHALPPVRGGGNQSFHMAATFAAMSALIAVLTRDVTGTGQHVDVSIHAAANITTEGGSYQWLVAGQTVQRQTGRHASIHPTLNTQVMAADGRYVTTGFPPHNAKDFRAIADWINDLGLAGEFPEVSFLELGVARGGVDYRDVGADGDATAIHEAGRGALNLIASRLDAYEFFVGTQQRGLQCGIIYSPEEALEDPHFVARGFPVPVFHPELDRSIVYPGAPFLSPGDGWAIRRRPPMTGEHNDELLG